MTPIETKVVVSAFDSVAKTLYRHRKCRLCKLACCCQSYFLFMRNVICSYDACNCQSSR